ncbi:hypothetical protein EUX98_g7401 [Antrodiella citrinella]|uniref:Tyrosinase copper-binding domain-containing protein n=1 Tax=Antrodiella citrinella TaxID=2447956 RepID=A0A4S4MP01_9APHY|nr:hypothetical protein EUX98_g7401 [Antrodiella citrinella]
MTTLLQQDKLSFFQIGGIHGLPYTQWNGSGDTEPFPQSWGGYCTHGTVIFPTWHRPYVALFEQLLQQHAVCIAKQYLNENRWIAAATSLRAPYWDWASNIVPPPEVLELEELTITTPRGREKVKNPLLRYTFDPIDPSFPEPYDAWKTTLRRPTSKDANATSNTKELIRELEAEAVNIRASTYSLLSRVRTWPEFSNHAENGGSTNSIESIHDSIHVMTGGDGHMGDPATAGFDPLFFLHHSNIDRLLSLWSALNPSVWVTPGSAADGSFTIRSDSVVDGLTDLTPFWNSQFSHWVSTQTTDTVQLGYTYPEFSDLELTDPSKIRLEIARKVSELYGGTAQTNILATPSTPNAGDVSVDSKDGLHPGDVGAGMWDWTVRVRFKKYELGGSFQVLIFVGPVPEDCAEWGTCTTYAGAVHAFVNSVAARCRNCRQQADVEIQGFVNLNEAIASRAGLGSFAPREVAPYLTRELNWRVQRGNRTSVALSELPSLEEIPMSLPDNDDVSARVVKGGTLPRPPVFQDKNEEREWLKFRLAQAFRIFGSLGYDEGLAGHITVRDNIRPDCFWVNPMGRHFSLIQPEDLLLVDHDANILEESGPHKLLNTAAFMIHSEIHKARSDVMCAAHSHSVYGRAFSALGKELDPITQDSCAFYKDHAVYSSFGGLVLDANEGAAIARTIGNKKAVILQNHGILVATACIEATLHYYIALDKSCMVQLLADAAAAGTGGRTVKAAPADALNSYSIVGKVFPVGFFSALPHFQLLEKKEGVSFKFSETATVTHLV